MASAPEEPAMSEAASVVAARRKSRGHIDSFDGDRICSEASCDTALSRYNSQSTCWQHTGSARRTANRVP